MTDNILNQIKKSKSDYTELKLNVISGKEENKSLLKKKRVEIARLFTKYNMSRKVNEK